MLKDINNVIRIPSSLKDSFFKYWFEFLRPILHLTDRETDVIAAMAAYRFQLSKEIKNENMIDSILMNSESRKIIRDSCNVSYPYYQTILDKFRKRNIIIDNKLNPKFIPNIREEEGSFKLLLLFEF